MPTAAPPHPPTGPATPRIPPAAWNLARTSGLFAAAAGLLTLAGWTFEVETFVRIRPDLAPMKPNTAIGLLLCGLALLMHCEVDPPRWRRIARRVFPAITAVGGCVILLQYLTGWNTGLDTWVFADALIRDGLPSPGRMTHAAAFNFVLVGFALACIDWEPRRGLLPAQHAALFSSLIGLIALLAYLYGIASLYAFFAYSSMAVHTAVSFTFLGVGVMLARPHKGLMSVVTSPHGGGMMSRRLLPAAILLPAGIGWLRLQGEVAGWYDGRFGLALFTATNIITFVTLVWFSARRLNRLDARRRDAHQQLQATAREIRHANLRLREEVRQHLRTEQARRRAEQQLRQSQKMEAMGTLAGGIAHDFNNILTAVLLNADRALRHIAPEHPARRNLDEIGRAGNRAADLVRRIMTFGRRTDAAPAVIRLHAPIREALELLRLSVPHGVEVRADLADDAPAVLADSTQLHQVILNLGTNALHAMEERGGTLHVTLEACDVTPEVAAQIGDLAPGFYARVSVGDTGTGIDKSVLARVFDPFFTTKAPGVGTGLGLSVVDGIVRQHGGGVTVYSEPGRGTLFHLYFPAADTVRSGNDAGSPGAGGVAAAAHAAPLPPMRVLCVDDDPAVLAGIAEELESLGHVVEAVADPRLAREILRSETRRFDVLLTDLSMPGMSGLDLAREARMIRPDLAVVLASGYLTPADAQAAGGAGIREVIQKPARRSDLDAALRRAVGRA